MKLDAGYHAVETNGNHGDELDDNPILPSHFRTALLVLISLITIGSHYGRHSLSSLGPEIMVRLNVERLQFGFLFSLQEIPGIVLPVAGGIALTYVPHGAAAVVLSSSVFISTALCAIAVSRNSYISLLIGRFLFGMSDGALTTLQGALVAHWFRHKIGRSFGVTLLVSRISSSLGLSLPAFMSQELGLEVSMWFSVAMCIPPFVACVIFAVYVTRFAPQQQLPATPDSRPLALEQSPSRPSVRTSRLGRFLALLHSFPLSFWLVCYVWVAVSGSVFSMLHFAPDAFSMHFGLSVAQSGLLTGSLVLIAGLSSPAIGIFQDRIGRRSAILGVSCAVIGCGILSCAAAVEEENGRVVVALGLALTAAGLSAAPVTLLSCLALCVDEFATAAALGIYKGTENAGLALLHMSTGALRDDTGSYVPGFMLLATLSGSGALAAIALGREAPFLRVPAKELPSDEVDTHMRLQEVDEEA